MLWGLRAAGDDNAATFAPTGSIPSGLWPFNTAASCQAAQESEVDYCFNESGGGVCVSNATECASFGAQAQFNDGDGCGGPRGSGCSCCKNASYLARAADDGSETFVVVTTVTYDEGASRPGATIYSRRKKSSRANPLLFIILVIALTLTCLCCFGLVLAVVVARWSEAPRPVPLWKKKMDETEPEPEPEPIPSLIVSAIVVDDGPEGKRRRPRSSPPSQVNGAASFFLCCKPQTSDEGGAAYSV